MKRILLHIQQSSINKVIGNKLELFLPERATIIDVINEADKRIARKGHFPSEYYRSLLHWVYNPVEGRFYTQASMIAYTQPGEFLNIRDDPTRVLPEDVSVHIAPEGPCITAWETVIDYDAFQKAMNTEYTQSAD